MEILVSSVLALSAMLFSQATSSAPTKNSNATIRTQHTKKPTKKAQLATLASVGASAMDDFTVTEMSPIILIDLTSPAEIPQRITLSSAPPLPRRFKIISPNKQSKFL